jgi:hypothetical protein
VGRGGGSEIIDRWTRPLVPRDRCDRRRAGSRPGRRASPPAGRRAEPAACRRGRRVARGVPGPRARRAAGNTARRRWNLAPGRPAGWAAWRWPGRVPCRSRGRPAGRLGAWRGETATKTGPCRRGSARSLVNFWNDRTDVKEKIRETLLSWVERPPAARMGYARRSTRRWDSSGTITPISSTRRTLDRPGDAGLSAVRFAREPGLALIALGQVPRRTPYDR